ncbi:MAG: lipopolysaccharide kinase InaA family protein [Methylophilaceae bacterium]
MKDFNRLWAQEIDWFETPNHRRGGWSGVGKLELNTAKGESLSVFVKKQQNHGRATLRHPIEGEPTFRREFERLQYLKQHGFAAPKVVFYDEKVIDNQTCARLVTEALLDYEPLDAITERWFKQGGISSVQKHRLLKVVAVSLLKFHMLGLVHRALYPKHIFVKDAATDPKVALIDLEKARFSPLLFYRAYFDLASLNRRANYWSFSERLYFFQRYFDLEQLTTPYKFLCRFIIRRSARH